MRDSCFRIFGGRIAVGTSIITGDPYYISHYSGSARAQPARPGDKSARVRNQLSMSAILSFIEIHRDRR